MSRRRRRRRRRGRGWKNNCTECGLELNVMVMDFATVAFAVTVHWPSASGTDFKRPQDGVPLVSLTLCCSPVQSA
jgi:hypothetical protein